MVEWNLMVGLPKKDGIIWLSKTPLLSFIKGKVKKKVKLFEVRINYLLSIFIKNFEKVVRHCFSLEIQKWIDSDDNSWNKLYWNQDPGLRFHLKSGKYIFSIDNKTFSQSFFLPSTFLLLVLSIQHQSLSHWDSSFLVRVANARKFFKAKGKTNHYDLWKEKKIGSKPRFIELLEG